MVQSEKQISRLKLEKQQLQEKLSAATLGKLASSAPETDQIEQLHDRLLDSESECVLHEMLSLPVLGNPHLHLSLSPTEICRQ